MKRFIFSFLLFSFPVYGQYYGAEMNVYVTGCQGHPLSGAEVLILGYMRAFETDKRGYYEFGESLVPGTYTIYAISEDSDYTSKEFTVVEGMERIDWQLLVCTCVGCQMTDFYGKVTDMEGKPIMDATVYIEELIMGMATLDDGLYSMQVPPGGWSVGAKARGYKTITKKIVFTGPEEPGMELNRVEYNFKLEKE